MISLADLQRRIASGELSADQAIAQSYEAIEAHDKTIGAFVCRADDVRAAATGPLRGIAVGVKDIIDTADFPTEMGSKIYRGWRPRADAPVVMMLKQTGASVAGKTTTTGFASRDPTATLNPRNHAHTPGGSSSGSAAAVAAGMIPLALGTQTGGSVIRPASYCGVAAIKPSFRILPTVGVKCYSWTLDTVGLFAAGVEDLAIGLSAMTNRPELLPGEAIERPRIGVVTQDFAGAPEAASAEALRIASVALERAGASVRPLALPEISGEAWGAHETVQEFEAHQALAWEYQTQYEAMPPLLRAKLDETSGHRACRLRRGAPGREPRPQSAGQNLRRCRRPVDLLSAGRRAKGAGVDRRHPFQQAVDADGRALRQCSRLCRGWRLAGGRAGDRAIWQRRRGTGGGTICGTGAEAGVRGDPVIPGCAVRRRPGISTLSGEIPGSMRSLSSGRP